MAVVLSNILDDIDSISEKLNTNVFLKTARESFKENIEEYDVAPDEKAKMIATYEAQVSVGMISEIIKLAKEMPELIVREENINKDTEFKEEQKNLTIEQTKEVTAQTANINKDTEIKEEQKKVTAQQVLTEKGKTLHIAEQIMTEKYRHRDLRASTAVKTASMEVTKQQAKFEEARRFIALKANTQNAYMKKADYKVQNMQALATDDDVTISAEQMSDAKTTIDNIPTDAITYTTEVNISDSGIETTTISQVVIS
ncbi:hypothetical protein [Halarcobacter anaerophilus]|uniref:Uncharacterized protein n=1 Tax=Halarcobacter anaerophilus TaxID=877500 RepID=A0A4Q0Y2D0_9BACT|nr:hypothetical protein [Halarcobacter anaerophilus]QDF28990.1 hypothetical protein AANAER_1510 [Halarcobacter anaerophilus]RXJ63625.1 hypothetical protein CRV06_05375 [Halarcobacter anaerophilus]